MLNLFGLHCHLLRICGEETDLLPVVKVMCNVVPAKWMRSDLSGSYIRDTTSGEMDTFLKKLGADGLIA